MEESISGFKVRGSWSDVVEHGERVTRAFRDLDVPASSYEPAFDEWEEWRPKHHEDIDQDVAPKTADQASVEEGEGEKAGKEPGEDVQSAGEKISESYDRLGEGETDDAVEEWRKSIGYVARAADSAGRKALRKVEDTVYQKVMTQLAPYYFDNALVSANIQQTGGDDDSFVSVGVSSAIRLTLRSRWLSSACSPFKRFVSASKSYRKTKAENVTETTYPLTVSDDASHVTRCPPSVGLSPESAIQLRVRLPNRRTH